MTCIAWDGRLLAGDRLCRFGQTPTTHRKVYRVQAPCGRRALVGYSGNMAFIKAHLHWLHGGERPDFTHGDFNWTVLMVDDRRQLYIRTTCSDYWERLGIKRFAIGSGADFAMGAMECGVNAVEAVRIASRLDIGCGRGVDAVSFD